MGKVTVYCIISGCTPEIPSNICALYESFGPVVTSALDTLADPHELDSQDDLCVIAPLHPSGEAYIDWDVNADAPRRASELNPETDIRVVSGCVMGDYWDFGSVDGPPGCKETYLVSFGCALMVQTYSLDILALATQGRMTPLRLWRLAMLQGFEEAGRPCYLEGVDYGGFSLGYQQFPEEFPGFTREQLADLEDIGDVEIVMQRLVHEGLFWMWMAPNRFPVSPMSLDDPALVFSNMKLNRKHSAIESLPLEVLTHIASLLPLELLLNLASASRSLHTRILGNDHLACTWTYSAAPWWIPVPTRMSRTGCPSTSASPTYLTSQWSPQTQTTLNVPGNLSWAYVRRCARSGSMLNRRRIWNTALGIERVANEAGV